MLNNCDRPDVREPESKEIRWKGTAIPHFNEGDIGAGVPQRLVYDVYTRKGMPPRRRCTTSVGAAKRRQFRRVSSSAAVPPGNWNGWKNTKVYRQPKGYFPLGGGTCTGVSQPGVVTWARFFEAYGEIGMDCGTGEVVDLPEEDLQDRLNRTDKMWPIANVHIPGYGRDELMATHMSITSSSARRHLAGARAKCLNWHSTRVAGET